MASVVAGDHKLLWYWGAEKTKGIQCGSWHWTLGVSQGARWPIFEVACRDRLTWIRFIKTARCFMATNIIRVLFARHYYGPTYQVLGSLPPTIDLPFLTAQCLHRWGLLLRVGYLVLCFMLNYQNEAGSKWGTSVLSLLSAIPSIAEPFRITPLLYTVTTNSAVPSGILKKSTTSSFCL